MAKSGVTGTESGREKRNPTGSLRIYGHLRPPAQGVPAAFRRRIPKPAFLRLTKLQRDMINVRYLAVSSSKFRLFCPEYHWRESNLAAIRDGSKKGRKK
jgi:hypothetical protein